LNIDKKYFCYQYGVASVNRFVNVHLRNFYKQHFFLTKLYTNNASSIGNQSAKCQLNLSKQTIFTAAFVRSPENTKT